MRMSVLDPTMYLRNASSCVSPKLNTFEGFIVLAGVVTCAHVPPYQSGRLGAVLYLGTTSCAVGCSGMSEWGLEVVEVTLEG